MSHTGHIQVTDRPHIQVTGHTNRSIQVTYRLQTGHIQVTDRSYTGCRQVTYLKVTDSSQTGHRQVTYRSQTGH